uniref:Eukaryotic translation initiation factor 4E type 2 n=1 Tax=Equus caballus TaxID=9796 RepID=F7DBU9_HORSE
MNNKFDALKDDDSGDHDQNEENSTQKDGEKEKAERDKSQGSSKRKAVVPGPAEHPLQYNYTFWYSRRTPGRPTSSQSYEQNIKQIGTFASVEQFWRFYSHMVRPGDLTGHSDFHLFKEGIKPMWEDDANKNGGKWIIRLRKGLASRCWENLILAMLGEQFMVGEEICGAVVSVRFQEDIISIWNKTASDQATTARIRDTLRRVLNLPPNTIMEYKTHTDSIKSKLSEGPRQADAIGKRVLQTPDEPELSRFSRRHASGKHSRCRSTLPRGHRILGRRTDLFLPRCHRTGRDSLLQEFSKGELANCVSQRWSQ